MRNKDIDKSQKKIGDLARKYGLSNTALVSLLQELGFDIKSPKASVTPEMEKAIKEKLSKVRNQERQLLERKKKIWGEEEEEKEKKVAKKKRERMKAEERVKKTLHEMEKGHERPKKKKPHKKPKEEVEEEGRPILIIPGGRLTVQEFAKMIGVEPVEVVQKAFSMGMLVTINQALDEESLTILADEFGYDVSFEEEMVEEREEEIEEGELEPRPPVVAVMGHVDHGKTTLLDYIRKSHVVENEFGQITQHIGAYQVEYEGHKITFIDTPGHEAFTAMRARGAQVTDIVILVVAANEGVKEQTVEAINHAKSARVPIIVAINKIDLPDAEPERVKRELSQQGLIPEEWGGDTIMVEVSAKTGQNVGELLEAILIKAEELELRSTSKGLAKGVILESKLDKGKGPVGTVLVQRGTLRMRDYFVAGTVFGRVRAMYNENGERIQEAGPSTPVLVQGFEELPEVGDKFEVYESDNEAKKVAEERRAIKKQQMARGESILILKKLEERIKSGELKELPVVIKADCRGSAEAISDSLANMQVKDVKPYILYAGVGAVTEGDVELTYTAQGVVLAFNTNIDPRAREKAKELGVTIKVYRVIYDLLEDVEKMLKGLIEPVLKEVELGTVEVRQVFRVPKVGTVAGCYVLNGVVRRDAKVRIKREGEVIYEGKISSLKRFKEDVREVQAGYECGIKVEGFEKIKAGDILEVYTIEEVFEV